MAGSAHAGKLIELGFVKVPSSEAVQRMRESLPPTLVQPAGTEDFEPPPMTFVRDSISQTTHAVDENGLVWWAHGEIDLAPLGFENILSAGNAEKMLKFIRHITLGLELNC